MKTVLIGVGVAVGFLIGVFVGAGFSPSRANIQNMGIIRDRLDAYYKANVELTNMFNDVCKDLIKFKPNITCHAELPGPPEVLTSH